MQLRLVNQPITSLAVLSAITYNSWPLGYLLNNHVARTGLFSDLEAVGQPYRLLFIILDVFTAVLVAAIVVLIYRHKAWRTNHALMTGWLMFAGGTLLDALLPLRCNPIALCNIQANQIIDSHNILGFIAMMGLFVAYVGFYGVRRQAGFLHSSFTIWALAGLAYLVVVNVAPIHANLAQAVFLLAAGLLLVSQAQLVTKLGLSITTSDRNE